MSATASPLPAWPPSAADAELDLIAIETSITIDADCAVVHAYATNASRWHEWHPATRSVQPLPDRPLGVGETIVEQISTGGRRFSTTWTVLAAESPTLWVIATDNRLGRARIVYRLQPGPSGATTRFMRTLECRSKTLPWRWLDPVLLRLVLIPQSRTALRNLKRLVERR